MSAEPSNKKSLLHPLWQRIRRLFKKFTRLPESEAASEEPIDFSAPSVPYYTNLSERFNLARIVLYMILLVFVVVTVVSSRHLITYENLYYLVKDINAASLTAQSQADHLNYPMSGVSADYALYRGGLTIVGDQEITVLSGSGKQTLSENVSLASPCVKAGDQYFLTFSRGERDFSVYNAFVKVHKETTEYPIYDACMARDGAFAVLTRSKDYTSEVIFYDEDMNKLAAAHLGGFVTAISISPDGKVLGVLSLDMAEEDYTSKLTLIKRGISGVTSRDVILDGAAALGAGFISDDRLAVMFEDRLCIYQSDGGLVKSLPTEDASPLFWACGDGYVAVLSSHPENLSVNILQVFDKSGRLAYQTVLDALSGVKGMLLRGQDVYIHLNQRILYISGKGNQRAEAIIHRDAAKLLLSESGDLLVCCPAYATRLGSKDFSELP